MNAEIGKEILQMFGMVKMFIQIYAHTDSVVTSKVYSHLSEGGR